MYLGVIGGNTITVSLWGLFIAGTAWSMFSVAITSVCTAAASFVMRLLTAAIKETVKKW
jgi:hypothetical protein